MHDRDPVLPIDAELDPEAGVNALDPTRVGGSDSTFYIGGNTAAFDMSMAFLLGGFVSTSLTRWPLITLALIASASWLPEPEAAAPVVVLLLPPALGG